MEDLGLEEVVTYLVGVGMRAGQTDKRPVTIAILSRRPRFMETCPASRE